MVESIEHVSVFGHRSQQSDQPYTSGLRPIADFANDSFSVYEISVRTLSGRDEP